MMLFSQRKGIKPVKSVIQVDSMDVELRNCLWNTLASSYWNHAKHYYEDFSEFHGDISADMYSLCEQLWNEYFKWPIDTLDRHWVNTQAEIKEYFFKCGWNEVYDFIEFIANRYDEKNVNSRFMDDCNAVLERELSAYRFVGGKIADTQ